MAPKDPAHDPRPAAEPPPDTGLPKAAPDAIEQNEADEIDNIVPTRGYRMERMVGLGGSAGSIEALMSFFTTMPADSGMVFVVVIHLAPEYESTLPELIGHKTQMPVRRAEDGMRVETNCVYVIPPGKHLVTTDGSLRLIDLDREHGRRTAVDLFFRSLADSHGPHAAAIVLSGADGDGAIGLRRIKERGGLTIAQDPEEAQYPDMPRTVISTGMVDWVLKVGDMPARLLDYHHRETKLELPPEKGPQPAVAPVTAGSSQESVLREVLTFLRTRTGRDFSYYKRATILRRIARRMQVNGVDTLSGYLSLLRTHPGESGALLKDLLISVTNFFRDRDAFLELEKRIPDLFAGKGQNDTVRVWVPACATGEEAYSMVMLLLEHARRLDYPPNIQVFGCDLDEDAIQMARAGIYPEAITADVSAERLRRFFTLEHAGYRIRREVRELVLFATHDLLKDAPFSHMDLISCRNLLIYLNHEAQSRVFDIFHFALRPGGLLFLGSSESVEDGNPLFRVVDKRYRIYAQKPTSRVGLPVPSGPSTLLRQLEDRARPTTGPVLPGPGFTHTAALPIAGNRANIRDAERGSWSDLHYRLIERFSPPSLIVNGEHEIQHMSESVGRFLQLAGGQPTTNLLRLLHPMLRGELRSLLFRAAQTGEMAVAFRVPFEIQGNKNVVDIRVSPARDLAPDCYLVVFDSREAPVDAESRPSRESSESEPMVVHLERELERLKNHLRDTVEQHEAGTEELKASNEELQAMNEELRSATEELETSREELQSINEELTTVNSELKAKVDELGHANSDLQNLMASTAIATVFLDRDFRITRFTPSAVSIFHLIPGDVGRPLTDLQHRLEYSELRTDAERVLATLTPVEREVREPNGRSFLARLLPYRTIDDRIAGLVLTFIDVTERQRAEAELRIRNQDLERFNQAAVGREMRMVALKTEVNALLARLGEPPRYEIIQDPHPPESDPP